MVITKTRYVLYEKTSFLALLMLIVIVIIMVKTRMMMLIKSELYTVFHLI